jgi:hypothetical protein
MAGCWHEPYDAMTLGEATDWCRGEPYACACAGRPPGALACYCQLRIMQVSALHRAAHIAVKQVADLAAKLG